MYTANQWHQGTMYVLHTLDQGLPVLQRQSHDCMHITSSFLAVDLRCLSLCNARISTNIAQSRLYPDGTWPFSQSHNTMCRQRHAFLKPAEPDEMFFIMVTEKSDAVAPIV